MSRQILIGLALVAALIVGGAFAWRTFFQPHEAHGVPRIAIVTDNLLQAAANADERQDDRLALFASIQQEGLAQVQPETSRSAQKARTAAPTVPGATASSQGASHQASYLQDALSDELEAQINRMLTRSRRFAVMDASSVRSAIERLSEKAAPRSSGDDRRTVLEEVKDGLTKAKQGSGQGSGTAQESGSQSGANGSGAFQKINAADQVERGDLAGAAADLQVRYLLAVSLREPKITMEYAEAGDNLVLRIEADPVFVYRLFDVVQKRSVLSDATQLDRPIAVEAPIPLRDWNNTFERANFDTAVTKALRELSNKVQERVAQKVADAVLDATFPAGVKSVSPLVMNRGENDGVAVGDEVSIFRVSGNAIKDGDLEIDAPESLVGTARVVRVLPNSAELEGAGGVRFAVNDIVRRGAGGAGAGAGGGAAVADARGLGKEDILANRANAGQGAALVRERVAVGALRVVRDDARIYGPGLQFDRALAERLAAEPRIEIMSREALSQLADERAVGGARRTYERGGQGVGQAGYMVLGDVTVNLRRSADTVDVAGAKRREVAARYALVATGALRIERLDSRIVQAFQITASAPIAGPQAVGDAEAAQKISAAFADAAARVILPKLFPIEVASVDAGSVVLNRGADGGLKVGDRLTIYALSGPVVDPTTRAQISAGVRRAVGVVVIADVQDTVSVATMVGDGGAIVPGLVAELSGAASAASGATGAARPASRSAPRAAQGKQEEATAPF